MHYYIVPGLGKGETIAVYVITTIINELTGLSLEALQTKTRNREVVMARCLACDLISTHLGYNDSDIARLLYPRDADYRTSVRNLRRTQSALVQTNELYNNITKQAHQLYEGSTNRPRIKP